MAVRKHRHQVTCPLISALFEAWWPYTTGPRTTGESFVEKKNRIQNRAYSTQPLHKTIWNPRNSFKLSPSGLLEFTADRTSRHRLALHKAAAPVRVSTPGVPQGCLGAHSAPSPANITSDGSMKHTKNWNSTRNIGNIGEFNHGFNIALG